MLGILMIIFLFRNSKLRMPGLNASRAHLCAKFGQLPTVLIPHTFTVIESRSTQKLRAPDSELRNGEAAGTAKLRGAAGAGVAGRG